MHRVEGRDDMKDGWRTGGDRANTSEGKGNKLEYNSEQAVERFPFCACREVEWRAATLRGNGDNFLHKRSRIAF